MTKIGFSLQSQYDRPLTQVVGLLKEAGFSAVSPLWSAELDLSALAQCVYDNEMTIQSLHAPRQSTAPLWQPDSAQADEVLENIRQSIDACAQFHVPTLVVHSWQGLFYTFPSEPLDFRCFDRMVSYAQEKGVSIAFENLEGEEYLCALLKRYQDHTNVGFCWDSGHDHCYPHKTDFLKHFGDQLIMTHLNDNFGLRDPSGIPNGKDDLHFLPYDGNLDWKDVLLRLKTAPYQQILNFEFKLCTKSTDAADLPYRNLPLEEFIRLAGERARTIAEQYTPF